MRVMTPQLLACLRYQSVSTVAIAFLCLSLIKAQALNASDISGQPCQNGELLAGSERDQGEPSLKFFQKSGQAFVASWTEDDYPGDDASPIAGHVRVAIRSEHGRVEKALGPVAGLSGDSWLDTSPKGSAYISYIGGFGVRGELTHSGVYVQRILPDGKVRQMGKVPVGDHPAMAVDQHNDQIQDRLFLVQTPMASSGPGTLRFSFDSGRKWSEARELPSGPDMTDQSNSTIASGGPVIVAAWLEDVMSSDGNRQLIRSATIDGASGEFIRTGTVAVDDWMGVIPALSIVREGPYRGRAYLAWMSGDRHINISYSDNGSLNWSKPRRADEGPVSGAVGPSLVATPDGAAVIAWVGRSLSTGLLYLYTTVFDGDRRLSGASQLTSCPIYYEDGDHRYGDYFNFDVEGREAYFALPAIRFAGGDSDVVLVRDRVGSHGEGN